MVDKIIVMSKGMVAEEGTFDKLLGEGILFNDLMENAGRIETSHGPGMIIDGETSGTDAFNLGNVALPDANGETEQKAGISVLIKEEERETGVISWKVLTRLWFFFIYCFTISKSLLPCSKY